MVESLKLEGDRRRVAEFDLLAEEYSVQHKQNIAITGEDPSYFAEYKIADLAALVEAGGRPSENILDFGSGIGNSIPFFRKYFPASLLNCADVSAKSLEVSASRFPGPEPKLLVEDGIPVPDASQDIVFSACVFHHIAHEEHEFWLAELLRITRPGGLLMIYEHNPYNPLTVKAVNTCPFDANARLIPGKAMLRRVVHSGWRQANMEFRVFFPAFAKRLRPIEGRLGWLPLGAQYRIAGYCQR